MDIGPIKDGVVINVICADSLKTAQEHNPDCLCIERTPAVSFGPGNLYVDGVFTTPAAE